jgi:aminoglycoside phosphotransferase (APT) family kinase protein
LATCATISGQIVVDAVDNEQLTIDVELVRRLVATQFPQWADLAIQPVALSGWDNRTFHLGEGMVVRMPSAAKYAAQVAKEHQWLPKLAPFLPLPTPTPIAIGSPAEGYPWSWSIYGWLEGESATTAPIADLSGLAASLAQFLSALQSIDSTGGPPPGPHSFYRGGGLATYDLETREAIATLKDKIDANAATRVWEEALASIWSGSPVWVHGDISAGNLLVKEGRLSAVIDFGMLAVGDPACDLAIAWTLFRDESREIFRAMLPLDAGTWARGRGWTLWKALIIAAGMTGTNSIEGERCWQIVSEVLKD